MIFLQRHNKSILYAVVLCILGASGAYFFLVYVLGIFFFFPSSGLSHFFEPCSRVLTHPPLTDVATAAEDV